MPETNTPTPRPDRVLFTAGQFILSAPDPPGTRQRVVSDPAGLLSEEYDVWCACWEAYYKPGVWVAVEPPEGDQP